MREELRSGSAGTFGARLVFLDPIQWPRALRLPLAIFSARFRRTQSH